MLHNLCIIFSANITVLVFRLAKKNQFQIQWLEIRWKPLLDYVTQIQFMI